jgi:methylglutaconyl-CoA hydratase
MAGLEVVRAGGVATVRLSRPEVRNALDRALIDGLTETFTELGAAAEVRVVVLAAEGTSFCAGGDLNWMREAAGYGFEENVADAARLAAMFRAIDACPKPVIARVQGPAFGGGAGLVAACDMAAALSSAAFCFSEVKLGLIPAVIAPFVVRKIGPGAARRYFLTAETFPAAEARRLGLVSETAQGVEELDARVDGWTRQLLANGPEAMAACKAFLEEVGPTDWDAVLALASRRIAERRAGAEGREGVQAFLEKRPPAWRVSHEGEAG